MNELIITYRDNDTGQLLHAHVCNTDSDEEAWKLVKNNFLIEDCTFESLFRLSENSSVVPF